MSFDRLAQAKSNKKVNSASALSEKLIERALKALDHLLAHVIDDQLWAHFIAKVIEIDLAMNKEFRFFEVKVKIFKEFDFLIKK
jgi:hypothetical protein